MLAVHTFPTKFIPGQKKSSWISSERKLTDSIFKRFRSSETATSQIDPDASIKDFNTETLHVIESRLRNLNREQIRNRKQAGVVVPLCIDQRNRASVLFTLRSQTVGTHKGQVSFPGGMLDEEDKDLTECALREMEEEIGILRDKVRVLGQFHDSLAITDVAVTPVVSWLGSIDASKLTPSMSEIDKIFTVPLKELADPKKLQFQDLPRGMIPIFKTERFPEHPIWGLTAYITYHVLRQILKSPLPSPPSKNK